jgi:hypothetical protein
MSLDCRPLRPAGRFGSNIIAVIAVVVVTIRLEGGLLTEVLLARVRRSTDDTETGSAPA